MASKAWSGSAPQSTHAPDQAASGVGIVLVTYHLRDAESAARLIEDFCHSTGLSCGCAVIVDNAGGMAAAQPGRIPLFVTPGDNGFWEFSGWLRGITEMMDRPAPQTIVLLNDSYGRNWSITALSRVYLRRMYRTAAGGRVAAWLDNFSHLQPPRFSRRPNSRVVFLPASALERVARSLQSAMAALDTKVRNSEPLFSPEEQACIDRWMASQQGRWAPETLAARSRRIFLEHHMLDAVPARQLRWFPGTWLESLAYAVGRRLVRERR